MYSRKTIKIYTSVVAVLMVVFAFSDLNISQALYNNQSAFGKFFEIFGSAPLFLTGIFSFGVLFFALEASGVVNILLKCLCAAFFLIWCVEAAIEPLHYITDGFGIAHVAIITSSIVLGGYFSSKVRKITPTKRDIFRKVASVGAWFSVLSTLVINVIKPIWGRARFREMAPSFESFSHWYLPQYDKFAGVFHDPSSFPSGHTASATTIFIITLLPLVFDNLKNKQKLLSFISILYVGMVATSRIIIGAHFASDVTMGATVSLLIFVLLCRFILRDSVSK